MKNYILISLFSISTILQAKQSNLLLNNDSFIRRIICSNYKFEERYNAVENYFNSVTYDSTNIENKLMTLIVILNDNDPRINGLAKSVITKYKCDVTACEMRVLLKSLLSNNSDTMCNNLNRIESAYMRLGISNKYLIEYLVCLDKNRYLLSRKIKRELSAQYCNN